MESRVKLVGHPVHPMLVVFPAALLATGAVLDLLSLSRGAVMLAQVAQLNIGIGLVIGVIAMAVGWIDWLAVPEKTRAKRIGAMHGISNMLAILMFGFVWMMRRGIDATVLSTGLMTVEVAALLTMLFAGWLGGELV